MTHTIRLEAEPDPDDMNAVVQGLVEYNRQHTGDPGPQYLLLTLRDDAQVLVGGLLGATYVGWLTVHTVWLEAALRGRGHGSRLMAEAEREAVRRGCPRVFLETFDFQALPFYEKLGYRVVTSLAGFPPGGVRYALTKELAPA